MINLILRKFIAAIIDRIGVIIVFVALMAIMFSKYSWPGYIGTYIGGCVEGHASILNEIRLADSHPDRCYIFESDGMETIGDVDKHCTILFLLANFLYLVVPSFLCKSSLGESMLGLRTYDGVGDPLSFGGFVWRGLSLLIVLGLFVGIRWLFDTTYMIVSIEFFLLNSLSVCVFKKSFADLLSRSFVDLKTLNEKED